MSERIHIISFDVPFPPDYGGVIDVFNRIQALHEAGFKIILHCFDYGRGQAAELNRFTEKVFYYKRRNNLFSAVGKSPMIVASRKNEQLLRNLLEDKAPILFEGQHSTGFLGHPLLRDRLKLVRVHNVEHEYYSGLFEAEKNTWRKQYFKNAARKLKKHEIELRNAQYLLCISRKDTAYYSGIFKNVLYLPIAVPPFAAAPEKNQQNVVFYHGNLSVAENEKAALWILKNIAPGLGERIIIAGKSPGPKLAKEISQLPNVELVQNPTAERMQVLKSAAKIHLLITFQSTGLKLKLIDSMLSGGFVICNSQMAEGTGLQEFCDISDDPGAIRKMISDKMKELPDDKFLRERQGYIRGNFGYESHAEIIRKCLSH
ncbi:MAG: glycosyltransferase [Brumimicrobium sp.]|nr:glycosyltransferase [Brumimicrobium sp.]